MFVSLSLHNHFTSVVHVDALLGRHAVELASVQVVPVAIRDIRDIRVRNLRRSALKYDCQAWSTLCGHLGGRQIGTAGGDAVGAAHNELVTIEQEVLVAGQRGGSMLLLHPNDEVSEVFDMTGLADVFTIQA